MPTQTETLQTLECNFLVTVRAPLDRAEDREWTQETLLTFLRSLISERVQMPVEVTLQHSREF